MCKRSEKGCSQIPTCGAGLEWLYPPSPHTHTHRGPGEGGKVGVSLTYSREPTSSDANGKINQTKMNLHVVMLYVHIALANR